MCINSKTNFHIEFKDFSIEKPTNKHNAKKKKKTMHMVGWRFFPRHPHHDPLEPLSLGGFSTHASIMGNHASWGSFYSPHTNMQGPCNDIDGCHKKKKKRFYTAAKGSLHHPSSLPCTRLQILGDSPRQFSVDSHTPLRVVL